MKKLVILALFLLGPTSVLAHDSIWKLCVGPAVLFDAPEKLVVSFFEHRSDVDKRQIDLTMIFGGFTLTGDFDSTENDQGHVRLTMGPYYFEGEVKVDWPTSTIQLNGDLNLQESSPLKTILSCKTIRD